jgi:hypothetical protein
MIPRTIHYCWFGEEAKNDTIIDCIKSWQKTCPDFEIKEWNELNFPVEKYPFASAMYNQKNWSLVSDFARLQILYDEGGIYLDTDMRLVQSLLPLTSSDCALAKVTPETLGASILASDKHHPFISDCKKQYETTSHENISIEKVLNDTYTSYLHKDTLNIYPPKTFYPFDKDHIREYKGQNLGPDVIGVHLWHYEWESSFRKFFKRLFKRD